MKTRARLPGANLTLSLSPPIPVIAPQAKVGGRVAVDRRFFRRLATILSICVPSLLCWEAWLILLQVRTQQRARPLVPRCTVHLFTLGGTGIGLQAW